MNAPLIRMSFSVTIHSDHVALTENVNRFKARAPRSLACLSWLSRARVRAGRQAQGMQAFAAGTAC